MPADGHVSQCGAIEDGRIFQAKGQSFTAAELLGDPKAPRDSTYPLAIGTIVRALDQMSCERTRRPKLSPPTSLWPTSLEGE